MSLEQGFYLAPEIDCGGQKFESLELKVGGPSKSSILVLCKTKSGLICAWRHPGILSSSIKMKNIEKWGFHKTGWPRLEIESPEMKVSDPTKSSILVS